MKVHWLPLILFHLFLLPSGINYGQAGIDSLRNTIKNQAQDSNKVNALNAISSQLRKAGDSAGSIQTATEALTLAKKIEYPKGIGQAYFNLGKIQKDSTWAYRNLNDALKIFTKLGDLKNTGYVHRQIGVTAINMNDLPKSLMFFKKAQDDFSAINDKKEIGYSYYFLALVHSNMNNTNDALINYNNSLRYAEEEKDTKGVLRCLLEIGNLYLYQENMEEALKYFNQRLAISKISGDSLAIAQSYTSIIWAYIRQKKYQEAHALDKIAYAIYQRLGNDFGLATHFSNISSIKEAEGMYALVNNDKELFLTQIEESLKNRLEAIKLFEKEKDLGAVSDNYAIAARLCIALKKNSEAEVYAGKSLKYSRELMLYDNLRNSYEALMSVDSAKRDFKSAFQNYKLFITYRDSNSNKEITQKLLQYEFDKKEAVTKSLQDKKDAEAKRLSAQQYFIITALSIVAFSVVIIVLIQFRNNKNKQKANALLLQEKEKVEKTLVELKSAQSQLIQSEKMASLGELTAGIAHEIQNPLNFVNNFSEVNNELTIELKNELAAGNLQLATEIADDIKDNSQKINHHGKRADAIVKGMLQHSQKSTGEKTATDINALADEYLRLSYHGFRTKDKSFNVTIKTNFDGSIGKLNIILQDIGRVLLNLYNNAFYAVNEKAKQNIPGFEPIVGISTKKINNIIEIKVSDNGDGVPQNIVDKIFQPFFTTKPTGRGTGLGLSISYDIAKAHGGEIKVETKEGEGTIFVIQLPNQ